MYKNPEEFDEEYLKYIKDNLIITKDVKFEFLIEYIKEVKKLPIQKTEYKGVKIGRFLASIKRGDTSITEEQKKKLLELDEHALDIKDKEG